MGQHATDAELVPSVLLSPGNTKYLEDRANASSSIFTINVSSHNNIKNLPEDVSKLQP